MWWDVFVFIFVFIFVHSWPELVPTFLTNIASSDILRMYNALYALRKVVKRYEYKHKWVDQFVNQSVSSQSVFVLVIVSGINLTATSL